MHTSRKDLPIVATTFTTLQTPPGNLMVDSVH